MVLEELWLNEIGLFFSGTDMNGDWNIMASNINRFSSREVTTVDTQITVDRVQSIQTIREEIEVCISVRYQALHKLCIKSRKKGLPLAFFFYKKSLYCTIMSRYRRSLFNRIVFYVIS